jgi:hypothetical protein
MTIANILEERAQTHGPYKEQATWSQNLKRAMRAQDGWDNLTPYQREALDMIAHKISRAIHGNPQEIDHWRDIAGYATLVVNELEG